MTRVSLAVASLVALVALAGCGSAGRDHSSADSAPAGDTSSAGSQASGAAAGGASAPSAPAAAAGAAGGTPDAAETADAAAPDPNTDMVSAVNPSGTTGLVSVKFRIEARPIVGMPVKIILALIPDSHTQIGHIHGSLLTSDGLQLQSERTFDIAQVQTGTPLYREVTVVPQQSGVLSLNATLLLDTDKNTETRTYSIPLVAVSSASS